MYFLWAFLLVSSAAAGYAYIHSVTGLTLPALLGALAGSLLFVLLDLVVRRRLRKYPLRVVLGGSFGLLLGVIILAVALTAIPENARSTPSAAVAAFFSALVLGYSGLLLGAGKGEEFRLEDFFALFAPKRSTEERYKILDTSVIIDGRIADICDTRFLEGTFVIPQFVLRELQYIADSPDSLKRNRGRRGLDILQRMQKKSDLDISITDEDFPKIRDVDEKLIALARKLKGKIITNDFNLNKVAELNGVSVLNINLLANSLKPVVLPGEIMKVHILREGKEPNQGVAYLDDGTMVVVDNARKFIGRHVEAHVTSVLQTTAGRMIFTQMENDGEGNTVDSHGAVKNESGN